MSKIEHSSTNTQFGEIIQRVKEIQSELNELTASAQERVQKKFNQLLNSKLLTGSFLYSLRNPENLFRVFGVISLLSTFVIILAQDEDQTWQIQRALAQGRSNHSPTTQSIEDNYEGNQFFSAETEVYSAETQEEVTIIKATRGTSGPVSIIQLTEPYEGERSFPSPAETEVSSAETREEVKIIEVTIGPGESIQATIEDTLASIETEEETEVKIYLEAGAYHQSDIKIPAIPPHVNLEIKGLTTTDSENPVIIDANQEGRIFWINNHGEPNNGGLVSIENLIMENGEYRINAGGIKVMYANVVIKDSIVRNCTGGEAGGLQGYHSKLVLIGVEVYGNISDSVGGGISNLFGDVVIDGAVIKENVAEWGGGIYIHDSSSDITMSEITHNQSEEFGGGIHYSKTGEAKNTITDSSVVSNTIITNDDVDIRLWNAHVQYQNLEVGTVSVLSDSTWVKIVGYNVYLPLVIGGD